MLSAGAAAGVRGTYRLAPNHYGKFTKKWLERLEEEKSHKPAQFIHEKHACDYCLNQAGLVTVCQRPISDDSKGF